MENVLVKTAGISFFFSLGTVDILNQIILNSEAALCIAGYSAAAHGLCLLHVSSIPAPNCDSQKYLQSIPLVCRAANVSPIRD